MIPLSILQQFNDVTLGNSSEVNSCQIFGLIDIYMLHEKVESVQYKWAKCWDIWSRQQRGITSLKYRGIDKNQMTLTLLKEPPCAKT